MHSEFIRDTLRLTSVSKSYGKSFGSNSAVGKHKIVAPTQLREYLICDFPSHILIRQLQVFLYQNLRFVRTISLGRDYTLN